MPAAEPELPLYGALVREVTVGSSKRKALRVNAPSKLSFYVDIPKDAQLSFRVGQAAGSGAKAKVRITDRRRHRAAAVRAGARRRLARAADHARAVRRARSRASTSWPKGRARSAGAAPRSSCPSSAAPKAEPAKNVIVVLIDTLRADRLARVHEGQPRADAGARHVRAGGHAVRQRAVARELDQAIGRLDLHRPLSRDPRHEAERVEAAGRSHHGERGLQEGRLRHRHLHRERLRLGQVRLRAGLGPLHELHPREQDHDRAERLQGGGRLDRAATRTSASSCTSRPSIRTCPTTRRTSS